jgi:hypothetical protein
MSTKQWRIASLTNVSPGGAAELEGVETKEEAKPTLDKCAMWAPARGSRDC